MKKGMVMVLMLISLLLSGCVATTERLESRNARAEKLITQMS